ncbi:MAG TPA: flavodoxin family protein [Verrucomicrobiota bacterium]|mgnify:CR=1 FL=1|nr:flavodoxin family protein [Verrucomicrobiota bacterium]
MKLTVFNGSPRGRTSNTHLIVEPLLEGARQAGGDTEEVFLVEQDIKHCLGCFSCWGQTPGKCVHNDDMASLIDLFIDSDYVGMATPVYGMFMTALLKKFTERLLPLNTPHIHKNKDGSFFHEGRLKRFPRQFMIANAGFPGEHSFDLFRAYMAFQDPVLEVHRDCGELLRNRELVTSAVTKEKISSDFEALRNAGREIVTRGQVSAEIVRQINENLITDEDYLVLVNQGWDEELRGSEFRES